MGCVCAGHIVQKRFSGDSYDVISYMTARFGWSSVTKARDQSCPSLSECHNFLVRRIGWYTKHVCKVWWDSLELWPCCGHSSTWFKVQNNTWCGVTYVDHLTKCEVSDLLRMPPNLEGILGMMRKKGPQNMVGFP